LQPLDLAVELSFSPAAQSRHHLWTVHATAEGTPFSGSMKRRSVISDMQRFRKTLTYLFTKSHEAFLVEITKGKMTSKHIHSKKRRKLLQNMTANRTYIHSKDFASDRKAWNEESTESRS